MSLSPARSLSPDPHTSILLVPWYPGTLVPWYPGTLGRNRESKSGALSFLKLMIFWISVHMALLAIISSPISKK